MSLRLRNRRKYQQAVETHQTVSKAFVEGLRTMEAAHRLSLQMVQDKAAQQEAAMLLILTALTKECVKQKMVSPALDDAQSFLAMVALRTQ